MYEIELSRKAAKFSNFSELLVKELQSGMLEAVGDFVNGKCAKNGIYSPENLETVLEQISS
jgi:hypothetical protein